MPDGVAPGVKELRGVRLFRAIGRRLASGMNSPPRRASQDDDESSDSESGNVATNNSSQKNSKKEDKQQQRQRKILRQPAQYTYIRGMSGLPTIRVPKGTSCRREFISCEL